MFKILFLFVFSLFLSAACAKVDKPSMQSHPYVIEYQGAMREMFETGDIGGKLSLASLKNRPHLYALGPLENLSGEITVWDGVPYISFIRDNSVSVVTSHEHKAIFLVWTQVETWRDVSIPATIRTSADLEKFINQSAANARIDSKPFPFLIRGNAARVDWHINNYAAEGNGKITRENHDQAKFKGIIENQSVEILGFYSSKHQGIFTHHATNTHSHLRTASGDFVGHLDDIVLGENMTLFLPQT